MIDNPYKQSPARAFWSRAVSTGWNPEEVVALERPLIRVGERVVSAGSCFAANLVPYLERAGFEYLRTESPHAAFQSCADEALGYGAFSAQYGNIYTARQLLQLLQRALGLFRPSEDRWLGYDGIIDPYRPGLRFKARSNIEFDLLTAQHLACVAAAFAKADVLIYTLGLTEAWVSRIDGAVFPACPGTVAGEFDPERHAFDNFTVSQTSRDLDQFFDLLGSVNPTVRVILTVSPVPLVATATGQHVLSATMYSKSVLRVAAQEATRRRSNVVYFPAFEIVTGPQAPESFFDSSRRIVTTEAVDTVMHAFFANCSLPADSIATARPPERSADIMRLSQDIVASECEEAFADRP